MRRWTKRRQILHLACLLTLLASGDDFNFARLVWPFTLNQVPSSHLPLDDETTDFVESPTCEVSRSQDVHHSPPVLCAAPGTRLLTPYLLLPFASASNRSDQLHCNYLFTPLRC